MLIDCGAGGVEWKPNVDSKPAQIVLKLGNLYLRNGAYPTAEDSQRSSASLMSTSIIHASVFAPEKATNSTHPGEQTKTHPAHASATTNSLALSLTDSLT